MMSNNDLNDVVLHLKGTVSVYLRGKYIGKTTMMRLPLGELFDIFPDLDKPKKKSLPKLDMWSVVAGVDGNWHEEPSSCTPPEKVSEHLSGLISNDDRFQDGMGVTTSRIVGKRNGNVVTKSGTEYELGVVSARYERAYPDALRTLMDSLPELG